MRAKSSLSVAVGLALWASGCQCADGIPDPVDARRDASLDAFVSGDAAMDATTSLDARPDTAVVDARRVCTTEAECQDRTFCNGAERCAPSAAGADMNGCVAASVPRCAASQTCDEMRAACLTACDIDPDADNDTRNAIACGGDDCDDSSATIFPGANEVCDGIDQNCVMGADEGFDVDAMCDPPGACGVGAVQCLLSGLAGCSTGPGGSSDQSMPERCNGVDDDCDGAVDETFMLGAVCDGVGECGAGVRECAADGTAQCSTDRGGSADASRPELCDMLDQDCDGSPLNGLNVGGPCDGVGLCGAGVVECTPARTSRCSTDPAGTQDQSRPELCDGMDNNCNGINDDGNPGAGVPCMSALPGVCTPGLSTCTSGVTQCVPNITPGSQPEFCDSIDNDCNGMTDERNPNVMCTAQNPAAGFVATWSCAGTCSIAACSAGRANIDGATTNGCECATDAYATTCASASTLAVPFGGTVNMTGVVETAAGSDFVRVQFTVPAVGSAYHPRVQLTNNAGGQYAMSVFSSCGVIATCSTTGGAANENGDQVSTWEQNYNGYVAGPGCCSDNTPRVASVIVRVSRRLGDAPTCSPYTVTITNN